MYCPLYGLSGARLVCLVVFNHSRSIGYPRMGAICTKGVRGSGSGSKQIMHSLPYLMYCVDMRM